MRKVIIHSPKHIELIETEIPTPNLGQALLKIKNIGVCGSDIHVYHGTHPFTNYPTVQGHEVSGEIIELNGVSSFKVGDRVTIRPQEVCGQCIMCQEGNYHICDQLKVMGFRSDGAGADFFTVNYQNLVKLPDDMSFEQGAFVEPLAVAVRAMQRGVDVKGKYILVLGAGTIGNLIAQTAKAFGAKKVMITDINDIRIAFAEKVGIECCINTKKEDLYKVTKDFFGEIKTDVIFDCAGTSQTIEDSIKLARKGTDIILVAVFGTKPLVDLALIQENELRLIGTLMYKEEDFIKAIELLDNKKIHVEPLITNYFNLSDYDKAYQYIDNNINDVMKVMISVE